MGFIEMAHERYSVRKFDPKPLESEKLDAILEVGRVSPTASNRQPQRILVLQTGTDDEMLDKLYTATDCNFHAPVVMLVCYDTAASRKWTTGVDKGEIDITIVTTQMMYAAWELGIGSVMVGAFDRAKLAEALSLPEGYVPALQLHLGYPKETSHPGPLHAQRLPLESTVFMGKYL